jgi:hypothetical protein
MCTSNMVVYSTKLTVSPPLECKMRSGKANGLITVKQSSIVPSEKLQSLVHYYANNQGREISLLSEYGAPPVEAQQQLWGFNIKDVVFFYWESDKYTLHYKMGIEGTPELLAYWLLHVTLPIFLTAKEHYKFLHAGAVEVQGKPIMFIANSFGGKSTMTDFFIRNEHPLISDDKVATYEENGDFFSVPSYPYHRPYRKAEDMGVYTDNFATKPKPVHAIYILERKDKDDLIDIKEIHGAKKFNHLKGSSQFNLSFQKENTFRYLAQMSSSVRIFHINVPWDINRLPEVYAAIIEHASQVG